MVGAADLTRAHDLQVIDEEDGDAAGVEDPSLKSAARPSNANRKQDGQHRGAGPSGRGELTSADRSPGMSCTAASGSISTTKPGRDNLGVKSGTFAVS